MRPLMPWQMSRVVPEGEDGKTLVGAHNEIDAHRYDHETASLARLFRWRTERLPLLQRLIRAIMMRYDFYGWPTRDAAAPEEDG